MSIYDFIVKDNKGNDVSLEKYKGKIILIVNTATGCGFTPQYKGLEELYQKYKDKGLVILDFPCNQFANQAPDSDAEIDKFCTLKYNTTFDRFAKIDVNGDNQSPLYAYLKEQKKGILGNGIKWNFTKFLVGRDGTVLNRYAPITTPDNIEKDIIKLL